MERKSQQTQENLLSEVLGLFKKYKNHPPLGPADVTRELGLFKGLNEQTRKIYNFTGTHNDKIAQGFINELLNRKKIKRVKAFGTKWIGYQYINQIKIKKSKENNK